MLLKRRMLNGLLRYWLPLITGLARMLASGAGAVRWQLTGVTIFSGMLMATLMGVVFIPARYLYIQRLREKGKALREKN